MSRFLHRQLTTIKSSGNAYIYTAELDKLLPTNKLICYHQALKRPSLEKKWLPLLRVAQVLKLELMRQIRT